MDPEPVLTHQDVTTIIGMIAAIQRDVESIRQLLEEDDDDDEDSREES